MFAHDTAMTFTMMAGAIAAFVVCSCANMRAKTIGKNAVTVIAINGKNMRGGGLRKE